MEKPLEFKGYVNIRGLEAFIAGQNRSIIIHNDKAITAVIQTEPIFVTLSPASPEPKRRVDQEPDYEAMYFEGDATIKRVYVTVKEHMERRFVKIEARHTPQPGAEKSQEPEEVDGSTHSEG